MSAKKLSRLRRARRARCKIRRLEANRLCVFRSPRHLYAQIIGSDGGTVLASASTVESAAGTKLKNGGNIEAAKVIGARIAEKAKSAGIDKVAFDRSGFKYHGRIQAFADAAREGGLKF